MRVNGTNQGAGVKICNPQSAPDGAVSDVTWERVNITNPRNAALYVNVFNEDVPGCEPPADANRTDWLWAHNLTFRDVAATVAPGVRAGCFLCTPGRPCAGITFDNVQVTAAGGQPPAPYKCVNTRTVSENGSSPPPCSSGQD